MVGLLALGRTWNEGSTGQNMARDVGLAALFKTELMDSVDINPFLSMFCPAPRGK